MKKLHMVTFILLVIGGLNWLLFGIMGWDVSKFLPGGMTGMAAKVIYVLVGLSAIYEVATHCKNCKMCGEKSAAKPAAPGMPSGRM